MGRGDASPRGTLHNAPCPVEEPVLRNLEESPPPRWDNCCLRKRGWLLPGCAMDARYVFSLHCKSIESIGNIRCTDVESRSSNPPWPPSAAAPITLEHYSFSCKRYLPPNLLGALLYSRLASQQPSWLNQYRLQDDILCRKTSTEVGK